MKRHFVLERGLACGRDGKAVTDRVSDVTCLNCKASSEYIEALAVLNAQRAAAFEAQVPREVREPWREGMMVCNNGHNLFRSADRTCYGHYDNWICSECGDRQSRLTETGMSF